ncbi:hypothetical protein [Sinorhizobium prairiense]|nr:MULTISPECIES: hypothetical protein [unclassified Sinorhizobium]WEJ16707.1 hypothetical protein N0Q91_09155 [Sinorhizobium sp. K101]WEJ38574.1 hypothetical protein N0R80_11140 [Sinorhizobium sp. C101]
MSMVNRATTTAGVIAEFLTTSAFRKDVFDIIPEIKQRFPEAEWRDIEAAFRDVLHQSLTDARDWDDPKGPSLLEMFR